MADHRDLVNERRFPKWEAVLGRVNEYTCPHCREWMRVNAERWYDSQRGTDLRPCPHCWKLALLPGLQA